MEDESETTRQEGKRRKGKSKSSTKKRKLGPLVDWGEVKDDDWSVDSTDWFQSNREEGCDHRDETEDWRTRPSQPTEKKLKQMVLTFRGSCVEG